MVNSEPRRMVDHFGYSEPREKYEALPEEEKLINCVDDLNRKQGFQPIDLPYVKRYLDLHSPQQRNNRGMMSEAIRLEGWYKDDELHGPFEYRYIHFNHQLECRGRCVHGKYDGLIQYFWPNGSLKYEGYFIATEEKEIPIGIHYLYVWDAILEKVNMDEIKNASDKSFSMRQTPWEPIWNAQRRHLDRRMW